LANEASADLLQQVTHTNLKHVVAAHLSERNNTPELARESLSQVLGCAPSDIEVASPTHGTPWYTV
jgi:phosphoribosyl 1,2-cyclic phosphodiesterase